MLPPGPGPSPRAPGEGGGHGAWVPPPPWIRPCRKLNLLRLIRILRKDRLILETGDLLLVGRSCQRPGPRWSQWFGDSGTSRAWSTNSLLVLGRYLAHTLHTSTIWSLNYISSFLGTELPNKRLCLSACLFFGLSFCLSTPIYFHLCPYCAVTFIEW